MSDITVPLSSPSAALLREYNPSALKSLAAASPAMMPFLTVASVAQVPLRNARRTRPRRSSFDVSEAPEQVSESLAVDVTVGLKVALPAKVAIDVERSSLQCAISLAERVLQGLQKRLRFQRYLELAMSVLALFSSGGTVGALLTGTNGYPVILACVSVIAALSSIAIKFLSQGRDVSQDSSEFRNAAGLLFSAQHVLALLSQLPATDPQIPGLISQSESLSKDMIEFAALYGLAPLSWPIAPN